MIYHLAEPTDWAATVDGLYQPNAFAREGFIHLSSAEQLVGTFIRYYADRTDLIRLTVDDTHPDVADTLVWESLIGGLPFPHLYARLPVVAVVNVDLGWTPSQSHDA